MKLGERGGEVDDFGFDAPGALGGVDQKGAGGGGGGQAACGGPGGDVLEGARQQGAVGVGQGPALRTGQDGGEPAEQAAGAGAQVDQARARGEGAGEGVRQGGAAGGGVVGLAQGEPVAVEGFRHSVGLGKEERKMFFFEKKNQKTFIRWAGISGGEAGSEWMKSFCFFFFRKRRPYFESFSSAVAKAVPWVRQSGRVWPAVQAASAISARSSVSKITRRRALE